MLTVNFYDLNTVDNRLLRYAVMVTKMNGQWLFVRHKDRLTWEIPGGHREIDEHIDQAATRELQEETGAVEFAITPICIYSVTDEVETFGQLFYAEVHEISGKLESEIAEVALFDDIPKSLTYPLILPALLRRIEVYFASEGLL